MSRPKAKPYIQKQKPKFASEEERASLPVRKSPYWTKVAKYKRLGYRKGAHGGVWVAQLTDGREEVIGVPPDLRRLNYRPAETLYLSLGAGDPVVRARLRLLNEASARFIDLAEAGEQVRVVAVSHRRELNGAIVIRHYPVAVFHEDGRMLWVHPSAHGYGLIRDGFPLRQRVGNAA